MADRDQEDNDAPAPVPVAVVPAMGSLEVVLSWVGFDNSAKRTLVLDEVGDELNDFYQTTERELDGLVKTLTGRPPAQRVSIGFKRLKKLKAVIH